MPTVFRDSIPSDDGIGRYVIENNFVLATRLDFKRRKMLPNDDKSTNGVLP